MMQNTGLQKFFSDSKETVLAYADEDYRGTLMELYAIKEEEFEEDITAPYRLKNTAYYRGEPWLSQIFPQIRSNHFLYREYFCHKRGYHSKND